MEEADQSNKKKTCETLQWALKNGELDEVKARLVTTKDVNTELECKRMPLHIAADFGQSEVLSYLISMGAELNVVDKYGNTPLACACYEGHMKCIKILVEEGADKTVKTPEGTPLHEAFECEAIKALLK